MVLTPQLKDEKRRAAEALLAALPLPEDEAAWARAARSAARSRLLDAGAPIRRDEYWKYTDPARLTAPVAPVSDAGEPFAGEPAFVSVPARRARFANGRFRPDLSDDLGQPGLAVEPIGAMLAQDITVMRELFGTLEAAGQEKVSRPLASLNTAAATEGLAIQATGEVAEPLHLDQRQVGEGASLIHHVIRVEEGASLTILESGIASNTVMEVDVATGGRFRHVRLQSAPDRPAASHVFARVGERASFKTFTLTSDGALTRNEVIADLAGNDGTAHVAGAVLGKGAAHADNTVFLTHGGENCESRQVFKNVLTDKAHGIFQGKIFVRPSAQRTDGYQISQAVLLAEGAEFSSKPELEIYADDVQCSHGSTTGALDETALFYLLSRGVGRSEAEALLVASFVEEAIAEIEDEALADVMRGEVAGWMAARS